MAAKMKIEVWSDIMCPFCYIGEKKLDDALAGFVDAERIDVEFKSFELMPGLETHPIRTTNEMLAETKGMTVEQARQMNSQVAQLAAAVGLEMDSESSIPANTINAHRLTHLAKKHGRQKDVAHALFRAVSSGSISINTVRLGRSPACWDWVVAGCWPRSCLPVSPVTSDPPEGPAPGWLRW